MTMRPWAPAIDAYSMWSLVRTKKTWMSISYLRRRVVRWNCPVSCRNILLTCEKPTASELYRKSCIIENDRSVWSTKVLPVVPWFLWPLVSRHANCQQKETFQAPTDLNSCLFSKGIILTSKPKWDFCVKSYSLVSFRIINSFASVRKCVVQLITMQRQRNRHYFKWIQSKFRGNEKFNLSLVKKNFLQEISCRNSKEIWSKSVRHLVREVRSE